MVMKCNLCGEICFPNEVTGDSAKVCINCGSDSLMCDHSSMTFDKKTQSFKCECGYEDITQLEKIRAFSRENPHFGLNELLDVKNH
ncbi:hypothetical protein ACAX46_004172 [Providencia rettgeri]